MNTFKIKHFDDYHSITHYNSKGRAIELGCWPSKRGGYGYCRYFGLFYTGRKPSLKKVMEKLDRVVYYGHFDLGGIRGSGRDVGVERYEVLGDVEKVLKY